eukprot:GHVR01157096.1.p2 GENE.GHVR01157096.1~~GHVR01157096.1.p2  ORF type:complete len:118 (-),score=6.81 GHVR01157096.1:547-900(-)
MDDNWPLPSCVYTHCQGSPEAMRSRSGVEVCQAVGARPTADDVEKQHVMFSAVVEKAALRSTLTLYAPHAVHFVSIFNGQALTFCRSPQRKHRFLFEACRRHLFRLLVLSLRRNRSR